jgi:RHS repeat-associated protein
MSIAAICARMRNDVFGMGPMSMEAKTMGYVPRGIRCINSALGILLLWVIAITASAQTVEYIHTDALGSPVAVTNSAGQVIERREYEPFGKQLVPTTLADGPGYTGHVMDAATGLTYMQQRYYDPAIGRFLSVDPVTADGSTGGNFNRYWYANSNPYKFSDPDGRAPRTGSRINGSKAGRLVVIQVAGARPQSNQSTSKPNQGNFRNPASSRENPTESDKASEQSDVEEILAQREKEGWEKTRDQYAPLAPWIKKTDPRYNPLTDGGNYWDYYNNCLDNMPDIPRKIADPLAIIGGINEAAPSSFLTPIVRAAGVVGAGIAVEVQGVCLLSGIQGVQ